MARPGFSYIWILPIGEYPTMATENTRSVQQQATLNDTAKAGNVWRATVSLILRNSSLLSAQTRTRIEQDLHRHGHICKRAPATFVGALRPAWHGC
ncbi:MAG: LacI family DNA-binding transcriptional regulator [Rhodanobacter sp.]